MSRRLAFFLPALLPASGLQAQEQAPRSYGPSDFASEAEADAPNPLIEPEPCEEEVRDDGVIVVCRELPESERYMSPLPRPVQSDRQIIPGLTDPPCWVVPRGTVCVRMGSVPEYPPLVDLSVYPEPLSEEDAALVSEIEPGEPPAPLTGERIAIDLSDDE